MAGKDKIERGVRTLVDDSGGSPQDLSGDLIPGSLQAGGVVLDEIDMSGVTDTIKKVLGDRGDSPISARYHMNDTATTGAFTVLKGREGDSMTVTIQFGSNGATPTTGDPFWEGEYTLLKCNVVPDGGKMVLDVMWKPTSGAADPAWDVI